MSSKADIEIAVANMQTWDAEGYWNVVFGLKRPREVRETAKARGRSVEEHAEECVDAAAEISAGSGFDREAALA